MQVKHTLRLSVLLIICRSRVRAPPAPPAVLCRHRSIRDWFVDRRNLQLCSLRRWSSGHVQQPPSGSWRAKVSSGMDPLTGRELRFRKTRRTEVEAQIELGRLLELARAGRQPDSDVTVAELLDGYRAARRVCAGREVGCLHGGHFGPFSDRVSVCGHLDDLRHNPSAAKQRNITGQPSQPPPGSASNRRSARASARCLSRRWPPRFGHSVRPRAAEGDRWLDPGADSRRSG